MDEGRKDDGGKLPIYLVPFEAIEGMTEVLDFGAKKYSDRNWENGIHYSRVFGAAMRHLWAWWSRRGNDPETGYSHLSHAMCCVAFLLTYERRNMGEKFDDRPVVGGVG